jgi:hypothetical protein
LEGDWRIVETETGRKEDGAIGRKKQRLCEKQGSAGGERNEGGRIERKEGGKKDGWNRGRNGVWLD